MEIKRVLNIENHCIDEDKSFSELLKILSLSVNHNQGSGFAIVVNSKRKIKGVVTDSDIRKFLASHDTKLLSIKTVMRSDFIAVEENWNQDEIVSYLVGQMQKRGWQTGLPVKMIPVLSNYEPVGLIDATELESAIELRRDNCIVVGLGYVGLTLALTLAQSGRKVFGFEIDKSKINNLKMAKSYIVETGIDNLLSNNLNRNFFPVDSLDNTNNSSGIRNIYFVCIGTPLDDKKEADLKHIKYFLKSVMESLRDGDIIVMRSTVPVGTGRLIVSEIERAKNWRVGINFHYVSAPERTVEGNAIKEIHDLPQIIGGATSSCLSKGISLFQNICLSFSPVGSIETAELTKIAGNAYRDYVFGFSNFLSIICQEFNIDVNELIQASNHGYSRSAIPSPSPGVGGPCLTKDSYFLPSKDSFFEFSPILAARKVNEVMPIGALEFIHKYLTIQKTTKCIGIGIAFKGIPETNDYRNSSAIDFINHLSTRSNSIHIWDAVLEAIEVDLGFEFHSENNDYDLIAILNNHPNNIGFVNGILAETKNKRILVFDPWRLLDSNNLRASQNLDVIDYFSLSHHEKILIRKEG
jgi:UDP-N-acetyl-D-mannosaminuronic acid dehydrogenase